ncbi:hypothetical protein BST81_23185 [Leptolyngbya sp. 'hensonii']|uniref:response regulator n=1 Tax=Leptolyngbya sp. 'hensonii' TaxID=1922337 RepID=UPI00094FD845|nr:hypothetical protein BST81_23185 [Leptolyngbya sp. 'hensonii']
MNTILVVEDSRVQRQMLTDLLTEQGYHVITARTGLEALEQVQRYCPDSVILDIVLPQMNGYEVCRHLKTDTATAQIPIVMLSWNCTEANRYWGLKQGADAYLGKPFHPEVLLNTLSQLLAHQGRPLTSSILAQFPQSTAAHGDLRP